MTSRLALLLLFCCTRVALAQDVQPSPSPAPPPADPGPEAAPSPDPDTTTRPPGTFRLGRLLVTPRLRLHTIGVDTNVLDTASADVEPRSDFIGIGGPMISLELPLKKTLSVLGDGYLDYVYYAKTPSQRRYIGGGSAGLRWSTGRTRLDLQARDQREYRRLDEELDRRVEQRDRTVSADLHRRMLGRIGVRGFASLAKRTLPDEDLGASLASVYDREELLTRSGIDYALTFKTRLLVEVERTTSRFDEAEERDGRFEGVRGGIEADSTALISGRIVVGGRRLKLEQGSDGAAPSFTYLEVDPTLNISSRTRFGLFYRQDQTFSVLASNDLPVVESRRWGAHLYKELLTRLELQGRAERSEFQRDEGKSHRDEASVELLYRWRRLGVGFRAGHVRSPASAFVRSRAFEGTVGGLVLRYR